MAIEGVAGEDDDIGVDIASCTEHAGEPGGPVPTMQSRGVIMIEVQVGTMNDHDIAGRGGSGWRHGMPKIAAYSTLAN